MSFVRPEVRRALWRWREVLAGGAVAVLGLYWIAGPAGLMVWVGGAVALAGAALAFTGWQRLRFRQGEGGPGVLRMVEGQIAYFGPLTGGVIDIDDLTHVDLTALPGGRAQWDLADRNGTRLSIPADAEGAEAMFDLLARLPGLGLADVTGRLNARPVRGGPVWRKSAPRLH